MLLVVECDGDDEVVEMLEDLVAAATNRGMGIVADAKSDIKSIKDLKGKRVAIFPGSTQEVVILERLKAEGMSISDIQPIRLSFSDMPARRAAASALSRTDGSMPSALHDTREFMISSGSAPAPHPAPTASPRVPTESKTNSAPVVCLRRRLFPFRVNNGLRNAAVGP